MFGSGGIRASASINPGLASIQPGTSSSLNGVIILNSLDDELLKLNNEKQENEEGELELSILENEDTLNDV
jgi:hypothetical protein